MYNWGVPNFMQVSCISPLLSHGLITSSDGNAFISSAAGAPEQLQP